MNEDVGFNQLNMSNQAPGLKMEITTSQRLSLQHLCPTSGLCYKASAPLLILES